MPLFSLVDIFTCRAADIIAIDDDAISMLAAAIIIFHYYARLRRPTLSFH